MKQMKLIKPIVELNAEPLNPTKEDGCP